MTFTKRSGTPENKVYEKLRKRSYRERWLKWSQVEPFQRDAHSYYVMGVRDAIEELQAADPRGSTS